MTEFDLSERNRLIRLFERFDEENMTYVIPRGYENLPGSIPGNDVDIIVVPSDYELAKQVSEEVGFHDQSTEGKLSDLVSKTANNPIRALRFAVDSPQNVIGMLDDALFTTERSSRSDGPLDNVLRVIRIVRNSPRDAVKFALKSPDVAVQRLRNQLTGDSDEQIVGGGFETIKLRYRDVTLHYANHLAYESPMDGSMVRVDPELETAFFEERKRHEAGFYTPSPPDELLHLVCRGLFDYHGNFPDYYVDNCASRRETVFADPDFDSTFRERLSLIFFGADDIVYEYVSNDDYDELLDALITHDEY